MSKLLRVLPCVLASLPLTAFHAAAQALPADTGTTAPGVGFNLPRVGGSLSYGLNASEFVSGGFYNNAGAVFGTNLSGDLAYVSKSPSHPFSAVYDGGVFLGSSGQPNTFFQSLSFSQVLSTRKWNISIGDTVSYLPDSPLGGLSGVPGTGDLGIDPIAIAPNSGIGILTNYGPRVSNTTSGTVSRQFTSRLSGQVTGVYALQRFIGDNSNLALDSTNVSGSGGVSYRLSARDSILGNYNYSNFSYTGNSDSFSAQGATVEYSRRWSARLSTDVYVGPQIISGSNFAVAGTSTQIAAGANLSYSTRTTAYSLGYTRGTNNGSGVIAGAFSDSIIGSAHRTFDRVWEVAGGVGYSRSSSLPNFQLYAFQSDGVNASAQVARGFGRYFSLFSSYSIQHQTASVSGNPAVAANAFQGVYQVFSVGVSYSPRSILLGR